MGKKNGKNKKGVFFERLAYHIKNSNIGKLADESNKFGLSFPEFERAFQTACELNARGPDPREVLKLPTVFQLAFIRLAEQAEDSDQINDLLGMTLSKQVQKQARRVLHCMQSRGLEVDIPEQTGSTVLDRRALIEETPLPCYQSPINSSGNRTLFIARYARQGVDVYQAEINDTHGLVQFEGGTLSRNRYRTLWQEVQNTTYYQMLKVDFSEARWLLAQSAEQSRNTGKTLPDQYLEVSSTFGEIDPKSAPPDPRQIFSSESIATDSVAQREVAELLDLPEFSGWGPDEGTLKAIIEKISEARSSELAIDDTQRIEQITHAITKGAATLLDKEEKRKQYQNRLLEMAMYYYRTDRKENAKQLAAEAWRLTAQGFDPCADAFFTRLIEKVFKNPQEILEQTTDFLRHDDSKPGSRVSSSNLIITP